MAESSDTRYTVAKLNNSNYQIWKFKVRMLLIREDTWTVVQGVTPGPVPDDWQRKDEKAQCTISLTVEDNQLVHICNCTSANGMWKQLQKVHERSNLSSKMYLRKKLYKMRLQDDQNMQEYISAVLRLVEQLRGVGEEVSDQQVATLLLCGLPDEYETLITALEARDEDELTLEYVKNKLFDAYKRKKDSEADSTESRTESAMYSGKCHPTPGTRGCSSLRSSEQRLLFVSFARTSTTQARAFSVVGPSVWNGLPLSQRLLPGFFLTHFSLASKILSLAVQGSGALLSSNIEGALYKSPQ